MKTNRKNKHKGWQRFFLVVILVFQLFFIEDVLALEENSVDEKGEEIATLEEVPEEIFEEGTKNCSLMEDASREEIWNCYSENMEFSSDVVVVQGKVSEPLKIEELLSWISIDFLKEAYAITEIYVIDELGNVMSSTEVLTGGEKLVFIGDSYVSIYSIQVLGDFLIDGIVNEMDVEEALKEYSKDSGEVTIEELSYVGAVVEQNTYEVLESDVSEVFMESRLEVMEQEIYVEDLVMVTYIFEENVEIDVNMVAGEIEFDVSALELVDVYVSSSQIFSGILEGNRFIYWLNERADEVPFLVLLFRVKAVGEYQVSIQNLQFASNGVLLNGNSTALVSFVVQSYGIGGDVEIEEEVSNGSMVSNTNSLAPSSLQNFVQNLESQPRIQATEIYLNSDNYIEKLSIQGYFLSFDKHQRKYQLDVENDVEELLFDIELSHKDATYFIKGNRDLKVGKNNIVLTVQAEDGSTRDYVIEVNKKEKKGEDSKENQEEKVRKMVSIGILVFLILSILWCLYLFVKKDKTS